jgi:excisionase family DNA binding protein
MFTDAAPLLTNEVARLLSVSPDTVRLWERVGRLPAHKTEGGVRLFDRQTVERFALERKGRREGGRGAL